jgi:hypothetical protein
MHRVVARTPESVAELCLVRLGIQVKGLSAWLFARRLRAAIAADARRAMAEGAGLLNSESFSIAIDHFGVLQYWRSFDDLDAWSRRPPHSEWWRSAVERMRLRKDFGVYHETFLVRPSDIESIYLDCHPAGLAAFGVLGEPVGPMTTSRGRLGRSRD